MPAYLAVDKGSLRRKVIEAALDAAAAVWQVPDRLLPGDQSFVLLAGSGSDEVAVVVAPRSRLPRRGPGPLAAMT
jgi:hypothetical protein